VGHGTSGYRSSVGAPTWARDVPRVLVAAGSNVEPEKNLMRAAGAMRRAFPGVRFSLSYRNAAVGFSGADFINFVAVFDTTLPVAEVLQRLHAIEADCGRARAAPKWAPRTMDLDMLLYGDAVSDNPDLKLPRPDLLKRPYMLGPAADVAPDFVHPTAGATIGELWARFDRKSHLMEPVKLLLGDPGDAAQTGR
jgi:2-amino-4-hydroxy-6-hydroxymethyldihydropteridine diphosphokinase